jgi:hypothetical protein
MTVPTTSLPSLGQWRLLARLLIRSPIGTECRASRMLDRANCDPGDLGELAEDGWVTGRNANGDDVDLAKNWNHSLAHVFLALAPKGSAWLAGNPHTRLLFEIADATGSAYRMKPGEAKDKDEVLQQLIAKRLIRANNEDGQDVFYDKPPSAQLPGEMLYIRLTELGQRIVSP